MSPLSYWTVEHAAQVEPQKMEPVPDNRCISVPEVRGAVSRELKATQTAPLSPISPFPTSREKVQSKKSSCLNCAKSYNSTQSVTY